LHLLDAIQQFDTCTIANAIETFQVRLRNELPEAAARIRAREERIVKVCQSPEFDTEKLLDAIRGVQG
jgi:hypothetical protein